MSGGSIALMGDMASVAAVGRNVARLDEMNEAMGYLRSGIEQVRAAGNAVSLTRLVAACRPIEAHAQQIASLRAAAGQAISSYANRVASLQDEVRRLRMRRDAAVTRRAGAVRALKSVNTSDPDASSRTRQLGGQLSAADAEIRNLERALTECDEARMRADSQCASALNAMAGALYDLARRGQGAGGDTVSFAGLMRAAVRATTNPRDSGSTVNVDAAIIDITSGKLSAEQVAELWATLKLTPEAVKALPIKTLFKLANVNGLPAWARDAAAQQALEYAIANPDKAYKWMGFATTKDAISKQEFIEQMKALQKSLEAQKAAAEDMDPKPVVQLLGLGNHNGAITAAISLGDLDTASNIGINIPGMDTNVGKMGDSLQGGEALFTAGVKSNPDATYAMVTWFGYQPPTGPAGDEGAWGMNRANAGGKQLAGFIDGFYAARAQGPAPAPTHVAVFAHSYGSTTAFQALKLISDKNPVDALVSYGSAGVAAETKLKDIRADRVYATLAKKDGTAGLGYWFNDRSNPLDIDGVKEFSSEKKGFTAVDSHSMFIETEKDQNSVGYLSANTSSLQFMGNVLAGKAK